MFHCKFGGFDRTILCAINSGCCDVNGTNIRTSLLLVRVRPPAFECRGTNTMLPSRSTSFLTDVSNVVDLGRYRNARQLRSPDISSSALRAREKPRSYLWRDDDYRDRMKVNAAVFVFLMFLITSGIWLLDGLSEIFGSERLSRQHSQNHDVDAGTMVRLAYEIRNLLENFFVCLSATSLANGTGPGS